MNEGQKKGMTLPNKLTLLRILLIPVMVIIAYIPALKNTYVFEYKNIFYGISLANLINAIIFIVASLTDMLDGHIARKYNLVTTFGKFADPLADKCLVFTALLILMVQPSMINGWVHMGYVVPVWCAVVIMIREFMVSGIRLVAAGEGNVIAAAKLGKWKTAVTMVTLVVLFLSHISKWLELVGFIMLIISVILTVVSGIEYFWKNRKIILKSV
ncbi:MAG: CDP-diacylglycerol--glycerol-3-phosphate 3-phosphatidyltransferase [Anaeroplasmataceae bacterium]